MDQVKPITNCLGIQKKKRKRTTLKSGMKLKMQIVLRPKQYLGEITQNNNDCVYMDFSIQVMIPVPVFIIFGICCLHAQRETCIFISLYG